MSSKLMDYFNKSPRIGTLSTADKAGTVDSGVFGSHGPGMGEVSIISFPDFTSRYPWLVKGSFTIRKGKKAGFLPEISGIPDSPTSLPCICKK